MMTLPKKRVWIIYCHTLIADGRKYIGQTTKTLHARWMQHVRVAQQPGWRFFFANAIRAYGPDAFSHLVLETCVTQEEANEAEAAWIEAFSTRDPAFGFNRKEGGKQGPHFISRNPWKRPGFREKMLRALASPAARAKMGEASSRAKSSATFRAKVSQEARARWADPGARAKQQAAIGEGKRAHYAANPGFAAGLAQKRSVTMARKRAERTHFVCKTHGPMALAECYSKVSKAGYSVYDCRLCIRARTDAVPWGSAECSARIAEGVRRSMAERRANKTEFRCKRHGMQPLSEGYARRDPKTGFVSHRCKRCTLETNRRSRSQ